MRHQLHREHGQLTIDSDWCVVGDWLGVNIRGVRRLDAWNLMAQLTGLPLKTGNDTVTADEWNHVVNMALARHA